MNADHHAEPSGREAGQRFPRQSRLTRTDEFSSVFGFRKALKSAHFLLHYRPRVEVEGEPVASEQRFGPRLGIVVAKRLVKAAVRRNLIKRLCREQFRVMRATLPVCDIVLRLAVKPAAIDRRLFADEIAKLLNKLEGRGRRC